MTGPFFSYEIRHVYGVEVGGGQEASDGLEIDMVSVAVVRLGPVESLYCGIRCSTGRRWFGPDEVVLPVRFIPHGNNFNSGA